MIVRHDKEVDEGTCASVRSSLSAQAWRVTAGSEAAETTYPDLQGSDGCCEVTIGAASIRRRGARLGGMSNESELPSGTVKISRAKDAAVAQAKMVSRSVAPPVFSEHTDIQGRRCIGRD